jgi:hypothetical protein
MVQHRQFFIEPFFLPTTQYMSHGADKDRSLSKFFVLKLKKYVSIPCNIQPTTTGRQFHMIAFL